MQASKDIQENIQSIQSAFTDCGDLVSKQFWIGKNRDCLMFMAYIDNMTNRTLLEDNILTNLLVRLENYDRWAVHNSRDLFDIVTEIGITTADIEEKETLEEAHLAVMSGDTAVFIDGYDKIIIISSKEWANRGVQQSDTEITIQGPKDAFTEILRTNTVMIRRRIRDTKLKVKQMKLGQRSQTDIALLYLEDVVRPEVLAETEKRLQKINIDAIQDSGQLEQLIEEDWLSPFPQMQTTERPDKASAAILEGRIAVVVDNTPFVILVPATLNAFYQSPDDYYQRWEIVTFIRAIRFLAGFIALALPGLYLAITVFHPSMIPMQLALKMAEGRVNVPFPAVVEVLIMELAFELLRESGIRLPAPIGSTIGIVGGIIIGQAVVEAGIISPIVVVIVAITGIASFAIPHVSLVTSYRLAKYFIIVLSAVFGLYGFLIAFFFLLTHLVNLKSFGIPYMFPFCSGNVNDFTDFQDTILRAPTFMMRKRPIFSNPKERVRIAENELNQGEGGNKNGAQ